MKKSFTDFLFFLQSQNALDEFLAAVKDQHVEDEFNALVGNELVRNPSTKAVFFLNTITWDKTPQGQSYWKEIDRKWREQAGLSPEANMDEILGSALDFMSIHGK